MSTGFASDLHCPSAPTARPDHGSSQHTGAVGALVPQDLRDGAEVPGQVDHVLRGGQEQLEAEFVQRLDAGTREFLRGQDKRLVHHHGAVRGEALFGDAQLVAEGRRHDERREALPLAAGHGACVRVHEHVCPLAALLARGRVNHSAVLLALDEQVPAHIQHLGTPAPVLRSLRTQTLHERFQRLVAVGELGVVVRFRPGGCRSRSARGPRVPYPQRVLDGVLELLRGGRQGLLDVEFQEAALMEIDLGQDAVQRQDTAGD